MPHLLAMIALTAAGRTDALAELSGRDTRPPTQSYDPLAE
jgi:hypothetical protein